MMDNDDIRLAKKRQRAAQINTNVIQNSVAHEQNKRKIMGAYIERKIWEQTNSHKLGGKPKMGSCKEN